MVFSWAKKRIIGLFKFEVIYEEICAETDHHVIWKSLYKDEDSHFYLSLKVFLGVEKAELSRSVKNGLIIYNKDTKELKTVEIDPIIAQVLATNDTCLTRSYNGTIHIIDLD